MPDDVLIRLKKQLEKAVGPQTNLSHELADLLDLSTESIYRRFRGEVDFSINEIYVMQQTYGIDLQYIFSIPQTIQFRYTPFYDQNFVLEEHLATLMKSLETIGSSGSTLHSLACDIPLFRFMGYSMLSRFKLFYWGKLLTPETGQMESVFNPLPNNPDICSSINSIYNRLKVKEVWTKNTITGTLEQIEYYADCGMIPNYEHLLEIYTDLHRLVEDVFDQSSTSSVQLYIYELSLNNNSFLIENDNEINHLFLGVNSLNSIETSDARLLNEYRCWLDVVYSKSFKISGQSMRLRYNLIHDFFSQIRQSAEKRLPANLLANL